MKYTIEEIYKLFLTFEHLVPTAKKKNSQGIVVSEIFSDFKNEREYTLDFSKNIIHIHGALQFILTLNQDKEISVILISLFNESEDYKKTVNFAELSFYKILNPLIKKASV